MTEEQAQQFIEQFKGFDRKTLEIIVNFASVISDIAQKELKRRNK